MLPLRDARGCIVSAARLAGPGPRVGIGFGMVQTCPMGHVVETAPTARSKCRGCGEQIPAGARRFGERLPNPFGDGEATHWYHLECAAFKRPEPFLEFLGEQTEPLAEASALEAGARFGVEHRRVPRISGVEHASSGRAQCKACHEPIAKGAWRIPLVFYEEGRFAPAGFVHVKCTQAYFETTDVLLRLRRFAKGLSDADFEQVQAELGGSSS